MLKNRKLLALLACGSLFTLCLVLPLVISWPILSGLIPTPQPDCHAVTQSFRSNESVEIILSGCDFEGFRLSPSGRMLAVHVGSEDLDDPSGGKTYRSYVIDLRTGEQLPVVLPPDNPSVYGLHTPIGFLTDNLVFLQWPRKETVFNYRTGRELPMTEISGTVLPETYDTDRLFVYSYYIVGLSQDYPDDGAESWFLYPRDYRDTIGLLNENEIPYVVDPSLAHVLELRPCYCLPSPNGKFAYRADGIYDEDSGRKLADAIPGFSVRGWTYDSTGVLLSAPQTCLQRSWTGDECVVWRAQRPLLKLRVADE